MDAAEAVPEYARIPEAMRRYGLSRSRLYTLAGEGKVRFIKLGVATLVDLASVRAFLASCPTAEISAPPPRPNPAAPRMPIVPPRARHLVRNRAKGG